MTARLFGKRTGRRTAHALAAALAGAALLGSAALAHHGWDWAEKEQTDIAGTIREIYIGPPHPTLKIETADDGLWTIELANPRQTTNAGFVEGSAQPGNAVVVLGHRSPKKEQRLMKAVRITVEGKAYDLYPERIQRK